MKANILLVDDESTLLNLMGRYLGRIGYSVEPSCTAAQALAALERASPKFDLAVVDLHLPDMSGVELGQRLCAIDPGLKVLFCTGDLFDSENLPKDLRGRAGSLQKPFAAQNLAEEIGRLLGSKVDAGT